MPEVLGIVHIGYAARESNMHIDIGNVCIHMLSSQCGKKERVSTR